MRPQVVLTIPLALLAKANAAPRVMEAVRSMAESYRTGTAVPPIPIRVGRGDVLRLAGDGNHRLAAARLAAVERVTVCVDERDAGRVVTQCEPRQ